MSDPDAESTLPESLSGLTRELLLEIRNVVLSRGERVGEVCRLTVLRPRVVSVSASAVPGQVKLFISRHRGGFAEGDQMVMLLLTEDGEEFALVDPTIALEELRRLLVASDAAPSS